MAIDRSEKSSSDRKKNPVGRRPIPTRSARTEAGKLKVDWNKHADRITAIVEDAPKNTYYCTAGDHLVDDVVWLEQVALGCKPCMLELRKKLTDGMGYSMRLWKSTADGTLALVNEEEPKSYVVPSTSNVPVEDGNSLDWVCAVCNDRFKGNEGTYNTEAGWRCKKCHPTRKLGQSSQTPLQRELARQEARGGPRNRAEYMALNELIEHTRKAESERAAALDEAYQRQMRRRKLESLTSHYTVDRTSLSAGQTVQVAGSNRSVRIRGDVGAKSRVVVDGSNAEIIIDGDVKPGARVTVRGSNAEITIGGHIHEYARVTAQGSNATINHRGCSAEAKVIAQGSNSSVTESRQSYDAHSDFGELRGDDFAQMPGPIATSKADWVAAQDKATVADFDEFDNWFVNTLKTAQQVPGFIHGGLKDETSPFIMATCTACGLIDTENPIAGRVPPGYRCQVCLAGGTLEAATERHRNWRVQTRTHLPKNPEQRETYYVVDENVVLTWFGSDWVRVAIPNRETRDERHQHNPKQRFRPPYEPPGVYC